MDVRGEDRLALDFAFRRLAVEQTGQRKLRKSHLASPRKPIQRRVVDKLLYRLLGSKIAQHGLDVGHRGEHPFGFEQRPARSGGPAV